MTDLIDREELKKSILKWLPSEDYDPEKSGLRFDEDLVVSLMMEIDEQPTVDAVPVVRCVDCDYFKLVDGMGICGCNDDLWQPNDFCSYGERKDGDEQ